MDAIVKDYASNDQDATSLTDLYEKLSDSDGNINTDKIESSFSKQEKDLVDFIQLSVNHANARRNSIGRNFLGKTAESIAWYVPVRKTGLQSLTDVLIASDNQKSNKTIGTTNADLKAKKAYANDLQLFKLIQSHVDQSYEYEALMPVAMQLDQNSKAMKASTDENIRKWHRIVFVGSGKGGVLQRYEDAVNNKPKTPITETEKKINIFQQNLMKSMLLGARRFVVDLSINFATIYPLYGAKMKKGVDIRNKANTGRKVSSEEMMTWLFEYLSSEQASRNFGKDTTDHKSTQTGYANSNSFASKKPTLSERATDFYANNIVSDATGNLLLKYYKYTDHPAMSVWRAFFTESFPEFDMGKAVESNGKYLRENRVELENAIALADKMTRNLFNVPTRAAEKITTTINKNSGALKKSKELLLGFTYNERAARSNAVNSLLPSALSKKGDLKRIDALKLLATIGVRGLMYPLLQSVVGMGLSSLFSESDFGEEEGDDEILNEIITDTMTRYGMFLVGGQLNAHKMIVLQAAVALAEGIADDLSEDDEKETPFFRTPTVGLNNLGLYGEMVEHTLSLGKVGMEIYENKSPDAFNAEDRRILMYMKVMNSFTVMAFGLNSNTLIKGQKRTVEINE